MIAVVQSLLRFDLAAVQQIQLAAVADHLQLSNLERMGELNGRMDSISSVATTALSRSLGFFWQTARATSE